MRRSLVVLALLLFSAPAWAQESDALGPLRERFRSGMEKYKSANFAEAIVIWEAIYSELGVAKGYRLAFNLARAYDQFGDSTRAAEHYEAYLAETGRRRDANEKLEAIVELQEHEAEERLAELAATKGRLKITSDRSTAVKIDSGTERLATRAGVIVYVAPGKHVVTFDPGTAEERTRTVDVEAGKVLELSPPRVTPPPPVERPVRWETRKEHPFSSTLLFVGAGAAVVSVVLPIVLYDKAWGIQDEFESTQVRTTEDQTRMSVLSDQYDSAQTNAYIGLAVPIVLGAATLAATAYWYFGKRDVRYQVGMLRF